jgi:hypothetical protein
MIKWRRTLSFERKTCKGEALGLKFYIKSVSINVVAIRRRCGAEATSPDQAEAGEKPRAFRALTTWITVVLDYILSIAHVFALKSRSSSRSFFLSSG